MQPQANSTSRTQTKRTPKAWLTVFRKLLENQRLSRISTAQGVHGRKLGQFSTYRDHEDGLLDEAAPSRELTDSDYAILALAQLDEVISCLSDGDPRNWEQLLKPYRLRIKYAEWRQDVWWMFYHQDPYLTEPFSLDSICDFLADFFRISITADAVRESCFRQGLCPPESKLRKKRCKRARIHVLSHSGGKE